MVLAPHLAEAAGPVPPVEGLGKHRPAGTRPGGRWLRRGVVEAAKSASKTKDTYLAEQYRQIARRRGPNKATVAVVDSILTILWHLMATDTSYRDLGGDYFKQRRDPARETQRLIRQLAELGYRATLEPVAAETATRQTLAVRDLAHSGSRRVTLPTAGTHFTPEALDQMQAESDSALGGSVFDGRDPPGAAR